MNTHASHNNQQRKLLTSGTVSKHVVKQQQLGIFKSKSNTLQSTPKTRRPLQQKELSFYSIVSYSNNNSLSDQSKSMTLNLPSNGKSYSFKERNLSPNQSSLTTPSPTQSNGSFALNKYSTNDLDLNYNSTSNMSNLNSPNSMNKARCNACWIKKCMDIYYEVEFDDKIMATLHDYHPIQLSLNDESNKNSLQIPSQQFNQQNNTLIKQKRYYTNNKLKSKSVSRLYYSAATTAEKGNAKEKTSIDQAKSTTLINRKSNGLNNSNKSIVDHTTTKSTDQTNAQSKNSSFNGSMNESNCSSSISDSNNSKTTNEQQNNKADLNNKNLKKANLTKANLTKSTDKLPASTKATTKQMVTKNTKITNNRSNSTSSNTSTSTMNLTSPNELKNATKPTVSNKSKNTITLNNLPFKLNNFSSINKPIVNKHTSILPNKSTISLSNNNDGNQNTSTTSELLKSNSDDKLKLSDTNEFNKIESSDCDQSNVNNDNVNLNEANNDKREEENLSEANNESSVRLALNGDDRLNDLQVKSDENIKKIGTNDNEALPKIEPNHVTKITTIDNNLNLLLCTNIHNS